MSLRHLPTQDERWLAFVARTQGVFQAYPQLIPLRMTIFRSFIQDKSIVSRSSVWKYRARSLFTPQHSAGDFSPVDVVFWLDSPREVQVEAIVPVRDALAAQGVKTALIVTDRAYEALQAASPSVRFSFPRRWQSVDHWQTAWEALRAELGDDLPEAYRADFLLEGRMSDSIAHEAERALKQLRPKLVVVGIEEYPPAATLCNTAHHLGIKTLVLLHSVIHVFNAPLTAQRMAVWGELPREQMMALGVPADQLVVLGSPRHDRYPLRPAAEARAALQAALGLRDLPYFVFFSNLHDVTRHTQPVVTECVQWLAGAAEHFRDQIEFVIRLHPNEDGAAYKDHPALRVFKKECDLDTTLGAANICASLGSTTMQEALLYQKPVLQFYGDGWPEGSTDWRHGLAFRIESAAQLIETLCSGLAERPPWGQIAARQAAQVPQVFAHHGQARQKVAEYIVDQLHQAEISPR